MKMLKVQGPPVHVEGGDLRYMEGLCLERRMHPAHYTHLCLKKEEPCKQEITTQGTRNAVFETS